MPNKSEEVRFRVTPETKSKIYALAGKLGISVSALLMFALSEQFGERLADVIIDKNKKNEDAQLQL